jgi:hypothetical protein
MLIDWSIDNCAVLLPRQTPNHFLARLTQRDNLVRGSVFLTIHAIDLIRFSFPALTMQAAILERKAAEATIMVEKYKAEKDCFFGCDVSAHNEYNTEIADWKKSRSITMEAAAAQPFPDVKIAQAEVQLKAVTEAAHLTKMFMDAEMETSKKALVSQQLARLMHTSLIHFCRTNEYTTSLFPKWRRQRRS